LDLKKLMPMKLWIDDKDYQVSKGNTYRDADGKKKMKYTWKCPIYQSWASMKQRVIKNDYGGCYVVQEWLTFSNFKSWCEQRPHVGLELDKDILAKGNKTYGPDYCEFVPNYINS